MPMLKHYLDEMPGVPLQTYWDDIKPVISAATSGSATRPKSPCHCWSGSSRRLRMRTTLSSMPSAAVERLWSPHKTSTANGSDRHLPTACRVMAKRLRDVCKMREDENYWLHGKGFVVRDLPWTEKQLRTIPRSNSRIGPSLHWVAFRIRRKSATWESTGASIPSALSQPQPEKKPANLTSWTTGIQFRLSRWIK